MNKSPEQKKRVPPAPPGFRRFDNGTPPSVRPTPPPPPPPPAEWWIRIHGGRARDE